MQEASQRHNELKAAGYNALDPLLTAEGEEAALKLGDELTEVLRGAGSAGGHDRLLITSPLRRAMQTAARAFAPLARPRASGRARVLVLADARERDGGLRRRCDSSSPGRDLAHFFRMEGESRTGAGEAVEFDFSLAGEQACLREQVIYIYVYIYRL